MEIPTGQAGQRCLVCRLEIKPPEKDSPPLSVPKQTKIFNVLKTYMKWEGVRKTFQFRKDLFPFCQSCTSVISRIWELNENVEELLRQIQQLTTNLWGKILLSTYRDDDSVVIKEEVDEFECADSNVKKLDLEKIESYRNVTIKRFTPELVLLRLDGNEDVNNDKLKNKTKSDQLGSRMRKTTGTEGRVATSPVVLKSKCATKDLNVGAVSGNYGREFEDLVTFFDNDNRSHHEKSEIDSPIQNDDDYGEEILGPDYHPPSPAPYKENEFGKNIRVKVHSKVAGPTKSRRGEKLQPKKVRKQKPYRLVEISPNLFVHADKYRIKKLSDNLYECLECTASKFPTKLSASRHAYFHSCRDAKRYQCGDCEKAFANKSSFDKHKRTPCKEKLFKCDLCDTRFRRKTSVKWHMKKHHDKRSTDSFQEKKPASSVVPQISNSKGAKSLEAIQGSDLNMSSFKGSSDIEILNDVDYGEEILGPDYHPPSPTPSRENQAEEENRDELHSNTSGEKKLQPNKVRKQKPYRLVEISPNLFVHADKYRIKKLSDNLYQCLECTGSTFSSKLSASRHAYFHSCIDAKRYQCGVCEIAFANKSRFDKHKQTPCKEKRFKCDLCGTGFKLKRSLTQHMKKHRISSTDSANDNNVVSAVVVEHNNLNVAGSLEAVCSSNLNVSIFKGSNDIEVPIQEVQQSEAGTEVVVKPSKIKLKAKRRKSKESAVCKLVEVIPSDDVQCEEKLDPDYHPPSPAPSNENEVGVDIRDDVHSKASGRAKARRGEKKLQLKKVRKQKLYRLVELSPNVFVHADKYRIKKLSDNLYECLECTARKFSSKLAASRHAYFHSCIDAKRYQCGACEKAFPNKSSFDCHKRTPCEEKLFKCDLCGARFKLKRYVAQHMKRRHKSSTDQGVQQSEAGNENVVKHSEIKLKAKRRRKKESAGYKMIEVSPNLFKYKDKYLAQKLSDNWYECLECHKHYSTLSSLSIHVYFHYCRDTNRYRCDVCFNSFPSKSALDQHLYSHSNEKSFICEFCGYAFVSKQRLQTHVKNSHSGNVNKRHRNNLSKNVICHYCGKAFLCESMLKRHLTIHTGVVVKPVSCEICGKVLSKYKIKEHMIRHGPPKFSCSECDKAFHMITHFNRHMKVIHGGVKAFSCDECGKSFAYKESIVYHKNHFHSERYAELRNKKRKLPPRGTGIYPCDQCGKLFYRKDSIKGHKKRYHSELTAELDRQLKEKLSRRKNTEH